MIRTATGKDLPRILEIYQVARAYMRQNGNGTQWGNHYPAKVLLEEDIRQGQLYLLEENKNIHGVFAFILGVEPTYTYIENGTWRDNSPYGTIHRVASDGVMRGVFTQCVQFCKAVHPHLRVDTHTQNHTMQRLIIRNGFFPCGTIYVQDGSPRIAYELLP